VIEKRQILDNFVENIVIFGDNWKFCSFVVENHNGGPLEFLKNFGQKHKGGPLGKISNFFRKSVFLPAPPSWPKALKNLMVLLMFLLEIFGKFKKNPNVSPH
jgi:hypothetical protein